MTSRCRPGPSEAGPCSVTQSTYRTRPTSTVACASTAHLGHPTCDWAYYLDDDELRGRWELIPDEVEVLITHTPPFGILDRNSSGRNCGCRELQRRLLDLHPRIHCFGHIHASAGTTSMNGTTFINASMVNRRYEVARAPVEIEI